MKESGKASENACWLLALYVSQYFLLSTEVEAINKVPVPDVRSLSGPYSRWHGNNSETLIIFSSWQKKKISSRECL